MCIYKYTHVYLHINNMCIYKATGIRPDLSIITINGNKFTSPIKGKLFELNHKI